MGAAKLGRILVAFALLAAIVASVRLLESDARVLRELEPDAAVLVLRPLGGRAIQRAVVRQRLLQAGYLQQHVIDAARHDETVLLRLERRRDGRGHQAGRRLK